MATLLTCLCIVLSCLLCSVDSITQSYDSLVDEKHYVVPDIVHQIYDYQSPNFFFYLSILSVQYFLQPKRHILYVNDEGRYRKAHWDHWIKQAREKLVLKPGSTSASTQAVEGINRIHDRTKMDYSSFLTHFISLIDNGYIEIKMTTFPLSPPHNTTNYATNKAHRSDFLRMEMLYQHGGIYLDTDAFVNPSFAKELIGPEVKSDQTQAKGVRYVNFHPRSHPFQTLRAHAFTLSFDNIVNQDEQYFPPGTKLDQITIKPPLPKRCNNGVLLSEPKSKFLNLWRRTYDQAYHPQSFDFDSSVIPYKLFTLYPDLVHLESHRISPVSYGFQTALVAEAMTCGLYIPNLRNHESLLKQVTNDTKYHSNDAIEAIWYPQYNHKSKKHEFSHPPDVYMMNEVNKKLILHLTMSQVRGICMLRKSLGSPEDLSVMPSYLGHLFRLVYYGYDDFNYDQYAKNSNDHTEREALWKKCRDAMGMHMVADADQDRVQRQQYSKHLLPPDEA